MDLTKIARDNGSCIARKHRGSDHKLGGFIFQAHEAYARMMGCTSLHAIFANPKFIHHFLHNISDAKVLGKMSYTECKKNLPFYIDTKVLY